MGSGGQSPKDMTATFSDGGNTLRFSGDGTVFATLTYVSTDSNGVDIYRFDGPSGSLPNEIGFVSTDSQNKHQSGLFIDVATGQVGATLTNGTITPTHSGVADGTTAGGGAQIPQKLTLDQGGAKLVMDFVRQDAGGVLYYSDPVSRAEMTIRGYAVTADQFSISDGAVTYQSGTTQLNGTSFTLGTGSGSATRSGH
jgi:hypothetical protein